VEGVQKLLEDASGGNPLLEIGLRVAIGLGAVLLAILLADLARAIVHRLLKKTKLTPSIVKLLGSLAYFGVWVIAILTALAMLGIPIAGIATALGAISLIVGLALQESIGNFAATINFLLFEPFKVGDLIESGDTMGIVTEIQPLSTVITKFDKKVVTIPNGKLMGDNIINYSQIGILRADNVFRISYSDDLEHALAVVKEVVEADSRVLQDPAPIINLRELGENGMALNCLVFVKFEDYWPIQVDLRTRVKLRFDQEGITIPFPQQTLHVEGLSAQDERTYAELLAAEQKAGKGK
jgi:small conductance mechanosensitive channel